MRNILRTSNATPIPTNHPTMTLFRVIGSVDIDEQGTAHELAEIDPFIFLDDALIEGELSSSFKKHPHAGLAAVTYLLEGSSHAWDNIHGATPDFNYAGGVYCIDSGQGIVHGEAPIEGIRKVRLLQMWFNPNIYNNPLPNANFQLFQPDELPVYEEDHLWVKIIIGTAFNLTSPVLTRWPIQYLHIKLMPHKEHIFLLSDPSWQGFVYVIKGNGLFGSNNQQGTAKQCLAFDAVSSPLVRVKNEDDNPIEFILAAGKPHHKTFIKLLGHGGAIVADTEKNARNLMKKYENNPESFGC